MFDEYAQLHGMIDFLWPYAVQCTHHYKTHSWCYRIIIGYLAAHLAVIKEIPW